MVLLGLVHASIERFGRRLVPLFKGQMLDRWMTTRSTLRREWVVSVSLLLLVSVAVAVAFPALLLHILPASLTASVRSPGGLKGLEVASFGFAMVPIGMLCSQYLFFLGKFRAPVIGALSGAIVSTVATLVLVRDGDLAMGAWGLLAGTTVYTVITAIASYRVLAAGEESFYASF